MIFRQSLLRSLCSDMAKSLVGSSANRDFRYIVLM
jgi:hypothetical protein